MPASVEFYEGLKRRLGSTKDRATQDKLLDLWLDVTLRATEYDAKIWGLDQDREIKEMLYMLDSQGKMPRALRRSHPE